MAPYATPDEMAVWAANVMTRAPDFVIGDNYLRRWWVIPRNELCNVYLHEINNSDDDRALHDHPWDNTSMLIAGRYIEHLPDNSAHERTAGSVVTRKAADAHRLEILPGESAVSLFITGPKLREWGFHCPKGWRIWKDFVDARDSGKIGRGCAD